MFKRFALTISLLALVFVSWCAPIDTNRARKAAIEFYQKISHPRASSDIVCNMAHAQHVSVSSKNEYLPAYYIFNIGKGFIIVSADDRLDPILGYSMQNSFSIESTPSNLQYMLDEYAREIHAVLSDNEVCDSRWDQYEQTKDTPTDTIVAPLLSTRWSQDTFYNEMCPTDPDGYNGHALVGCVATSMAQVINYWKHPVVGNGEYGYEANYASIGDGYGDYGYLYANFGETTYDYANMPDQLDSTSTAEQIAAVATLMYHCGVSLQSLYGVSGTGAISIMAINALRDHFRYADSPRFLFKSSYTMQEWVTLLKSELDASAPIMYGGNDTIGGHSFVCDGYGSDNFFHMNWGWNGKYDGFYRLTALNPNYYNFASSQSAIINIRPMVVGVESFDNEFSIFPNPVQSQITISSVENIQQIVITDISGKILRQENLHNNTATLDLSNLKTGLYLLRISTDKGTNIQKIIKH